MPLCCVMVGRHHSTACCSTLSVASCSHPTVRILTTVKPDSRAGKDIHDIIGELAWRKVPQEMETLTEWIKHNH